MSDHPDSTTAPKSIGELSENIVRSLAAKRMAVASLLEEPISDANRMASVLTTLVERAFDKDMSSIIGARGKDTYHVIEDDREDIMFSVYKVQDYLRGIEDAFNEATR